MTDKELIILAAKAAGIEGKWGKEGYIERNEGFIPDGWLRAWNPLSDDRDALRLAVNLNLDILQDAKSVGVCVEVIANDYENNEGFQPFGIVAKDCDPYAATRRAIVLAATEIGKGM